ncbi:MAG: type II toxin-antitoxin system HicA family toxin [Candidatus Eremiobacteraeota bacterium]|nr:type II toxin-antitoxin system HicA family toxin [Candidatus Eremiobacteraeota bacterium]
MKVRTVLRWLRQGGWFLARSVGSHRHFAHPTKPGLVTVPGKERSELSPKTFASICKQAGWPKTGPEKM